MGAEDEDENDDNVSLTSTTWTEFRSDYDEEQEQFTVDKVIGETEDEENYLLQWVGYPVERASWTPADAVPAEALCEWQKHQVLVDAGLARNLDVKKWHLRTERLLTEMLARKAKRAAKRKRLGVTTKARRTVSTLNTRQRVNDAHSIEAEKSPSLDSLFEEDGELENATAPTCPTDSAEPDGPLFVGNEAAESTKAREQPRPPVTVSQQPAKSTPSSVNASISTVASRPKIRPVPNIFANFNSRKTIKRRGKGHLSPDKSGGTNGDKGDVPPVIRPMLLSEVHRIQKAAANEPEPTITFEQMQAMKINSGVRRPPLRPPQAATGSSGTSPTKSSNAAGRVDISNAPTGPRMDRKIPLTCFFWADGHCAKSDEECLYAHKMLNDFGRPSRWNGESPRYWTKPIQDVPIPIVPPARPSLPISTTPISFKETLSAITDLPTLVNDSPSKASTTMSSLNDSPTRTKAPMRTKVAPVIRTRFVTQIFSDAPVKLSPLPAAAEERVETSLTTDPRLSVTFCTSNIAYNMFKHGDLPSKTWSGTVSPMDNSSSLQQFVDDLVQQANRDQKPSMAGVIFRKTWVMVVYPASHKQFWEDGTEVESTDKGADHLLHFQVMIPERYLLNGSISSNPTVECSAIESRAIERQGVSRQCFATYVFRELGGITIEDIDKLFEWVTGTLSRRAFLRFEGHPRDRDALAALLISHHVKVSNSDQHGAWEDWKRDLGHKHGGAVIFHPANQNWADVDHLAFLLNDKCNFWMFGACSDDHWQRHNTYETLQLWKLWDRGSAVLVVDDLFENHPGRALKVVDHIVGKAEQASWMERTWKLAGRPSLSQWLLELIKDRGEVAQSGTVSDRLALHERVFRSLCPVALCDPSFPDTPTHVASLISEYPHNYRSFAECCPERSEEEILVYWFAMWAMTQQFEFRRFIVVVDTVGEAQEAYKSQWKHIDVITPEKYIQRYQSA